MTIGFIDNDILLKLVAFQLFEEAISSLADLQVLQYERRFRATLAISTVLHQAS
ncbi:MAG: hypothetical protein AAFO84_11915 [Cyanobacteria bacterium J06598_1]